MNRIEEWQKIFRKIDDEILIPYKFNRLIAERYFDIIKPTIKDGGDPTFHNWCNDNYARSLLLTIRMLCDENKESCSIRYVLGQIAEHANEIKKNDYISRHESRWQDTVRNIWNNEIGSDQENLPRAIPLKHIEELRSLSASIVGITHNHIAHKSRNETATFTIEFDEAYRVIRRLISICHFYADLVGEIVPNDDLNVSFCYNWESIFYQPWLKHSRPVPSRVRKTRVT
jgi:hypothetical protein